MSTIYGWRLISVGSARSKGVQDNRTLRQRLEPTLTMLHYGFTFDRLAQWFRCTSGDLHQNWRHAPMPTDYHSVGSSVDRTK